MRSSQSGTSKNYSHATLPSTAITFTGQLLCSSFHVLTIMSGYKISVPFNVKAISAAVFEHEFLPSALIRIYKGSMYLVDLCGLSNREASHALANQD